MNKREFIADYAENTYSFSGTSEDYFIARLIYRYMEGAEILDIGCGPVHHLLAIFFRHCRNTTALDLHRENIAYIENCVASGIILPCQRNAVKYRMRYLDSCRLTTSPEQVVLDAYKRIGQLLSGDILDRIDDFQGRFDCAMQIGCFGALNTLDEFRMAIAHAATYLKPGGRLLMINWLQEEYTYRPYRFNGKVSSLLSKDLYQEALIAANLDIVKMGMTKKIAKEDMKIGYSQIIYSISAKGL